MRKQHTLANVADRQGRVDVALYRIADRLLGQLETERSVTGLRAHVLPLVEAAIRQSIPARNLIPPEIEVALNFCRHYRRAIGSGHQ